MKKKVLFSAIVASVALVSCSQSTTTPQESIEPQPSTLLSELSVFNQEMISIHPNIDTRSRFLRFCAVYGADVIAGYEGAKIGAAGGAEIGAWVGHPISGAAIGAASLGLICGAGASYLAYKGTDSCDVDPDMLYSTMMDSFIDYYPYIIDVISGATDDRAEEEAEEDPNPMVIEENDIDDVEDLEIPHFAIVVGAAHNILLDELQRGRKSLTRVTDSPVDSVIPDEVTSFLQDQEVHDFCVSYYEGLIANTPVAFESLPDQVIEIYLDLLRSSNLDDSLIVDYINHYFSIISNSKELSQQEKECIYIGLAVSLFSHNYWEQYGVLEESL